MLKNTLKNFPGVVTVDRYNQLHHLLCMLSYPHLVLAHLGNQHKNNDHTTCPKYPSPNYSSH